MNFERSEPTDRSRVRFGAVECGPDRSEARVNLAYEFEPRRRVRGTAGEGKDDRTGRDRGVGRRRTDGGQQGRRRTGERHGARAACAVRPVRSCGCGRGVG